jgi:hypothetical protein
MIKKNLFLSLIFSIAFISCQKFDHTDPANYQSRFLNFDNWLGLGVDDLGNFYMQSPASFYKFDGEKLKVLFSGNLEIRDFEILDSENIWILLEGNLLYHIGRTGIKAFQLSPGESLSMSVSKKNTGEILIGIENELDIHRVLIYEISEQLNQVSLKKELTNYGYQITGVDYEGNFWIRTAESNNEHLVYDGVSEKLVQINGLVWIYNNQENSLFLTYESSFKLWRYNGSGFEQVEIYNNNFFSELNSDFRRAEYLDNENFLVFYGDNSFGIYSNAGSYDYFSDPDNLVSPGVYVSNKSGVCWGLYGSENLVRFKNGIWTYYPYEILTL